MSNSIQRPIVRYMMICADAGLNITPPHDLANAWWELVNPLYDVWMPEGVSSNFLVEEVSVFVQMTDGQGTLNLGCRLEQIDLANPARNILLYLAGPFPTEFSNPRAVVNDVYVFQSVPIPTPGLYQFSLVESGEVLEGGTAFLRIMAGDD